METHPADRDEGGRPLRVQVRQPSELGNGARAEWWAGRGERGMPALPIFLWMRNVGLLPVADVVPVTQHGGMNALFSGAGGLGLLASAAVAAAPNVAVYSNVCLSPRTHDQGGMELSLSRSDGRWLVALRTCEGGCMTWSTTDVVRRGNLLTFAAAYPIYDEKGAPAGMVSDRFRGRLTERAAVVTAEKGNRTETLMRQPWAIDAGDDVPTEPDLPPTPVRRC